PVELRDPGVGGDHPSPVYRSGIGGGGGGGPAGGAPDHEPGNQGRARRRSAHRQSGGGYGSPRPDREKAGPWPVRGVDGFLPGSDSPLLPDQHPRSDGGGEEGPTGPGSGLSRGGCEDRAGSPPGCRRVGGREGGGAGS